jgi:uncharacterized coiled-coil protein SlyX
MNDFQEPSHFKPLESTPLPVVAPIVKRAVPIAAAAVLAICGIAYALYEHHSAQNLASQNQQMSTQLNTTHAQLDALVARVNELASNSAPAPAETPAAAPKPSPKNPTGGGEHAAAVHRPSAADQRFSKMQSQIDAQNQAISDTRNDLTSARTELSGSIAKTHDELVVLEKKGERNFTEFDVQKAKDFKRTGPVSVKLKKANVKSQYADLQLIVDDRTLTDKHINLYQPAMFYQPDAQQPVEIVINSITKDHIHGYISAPKYRPSDLAAMPNAPGNQDQASNSSPQPARQRLPLPADNGPVQP